MRAGVGEEDEGHEGREGRVEGVMGGCVAEGLWLVGGFVARWRLGVREDERDGVECCVVEVLGCGRCRNAVALVCSNYL